MRQTKTLLSSSVVPSPTGLCSLSSLTAASWPFPTLSLRIFLWMLGPIPRRFFWCIHSFLPRRQRPSPTWEWLGTQRYPYCNFCPEGFFGAVRVGWRLLRLQDEVGVLCLPPAFAAVPQYVIHTRVALQPLSEPDKRLSQHPAPRSVIQQASALRQEFRSLRMRGVGQSSAAKAWMNPAHVYALRWLLRLSHLNRSRVA